MEKHGSGKIQDIRRVDAAKTAESGGNPVLTSSREFKPTAPAFPDLPKRPGEPDESADK